MAFSQPTDLGFSFASSYSKCHSLQRSNVFHIVSSCFIVVSSCFFSSLGNHKNSRCDLSTCMHQVPHPRQRLGMEGPLVYDPEWSSEPKERSG